MPPSLRDAFTVFFDEQSQIEARRIRQENLDYQAGLAQTLLDSGKGWEEVVALQPGDEREELSSFLDVCMKDDTLSGFYIPGGTLPAPTMTLFYRDLYGFDRRSEDDEGLVCIESRPILVNHRDREHPYQRYDDLSECMQAVQQETSYIYMGSFWQPPNGYLTARRNAMTTINGFCVDLDRVEDDKGLYFQPDWVMRTLLETLEKHPQIMPNYLMLSGTGIQLWYVFGEQVPLLSAKARNMPDGTKRKASPRRDKFQQVLRALYGFFDKELPKNRFRVDTPCATINHPFRAPASPAKHHYPTRLFVMGGWSRKMIDPLILSDYLGCNLKPYDLENWDQVEYERINEERQRNRLKRTSPATERQLAWIGKLENMGCIGDVPDELTVADADALIKRGEIVFTRRQQRMAGEGVIETTSGHRVPTRPRDPGLYRYTLRRIVRDTPPGSRYNALFGLAGLGWNCGIPKIQVERDMMGLLDTDWARRFGNDGKPLSKKDVKAALRGWNKLGALRPRSQLEDRLQWSYNPPAKRNGRKQDVHLDMIARPMIETYRTLGETEHLPGRPKGSGTKEQIIRAYAAAHPDANYSQIARALDVSRTTVIKWLRDTPEV